MFTGTFCLSLELLLHFAALRPNFKIQTCIKFVAALFKLHILPGELTYSR